MKIAISRDILSIMFLVFITFSISGSSQITKQDSSYNEKEVSFSNGNIILAGSILTPKGKCPFPAVVVIHGSGGKINHRKHSGVTPFVKALVKRGIAVLYPDKRGQGKSEGTWYSASFVDLADDAIAGVELLYKTPKINKEKIGVIGFSQGGIIVPVVASRSSKVAFAINSSGTTIPMVEALMDEIEIAAELTGLSAKQIKTISDINRKGIHYALTGKGADEYLKALNNGKETKLKNSPVVQAFPTKPNPGLIQFLKLIGRFDPLPYWKKVKVPSLFIYGGKDRLLRPKKSIDRIQKTFGKSGFDYTILFFNNRGHSTFGEDLIDFIAGWISNK